MITLLTDEQLDAWLDANCAVRGNDHLRRLMGFWQDALDGRRLIWCAWDKGVYAGHISLQLQSEYPPFAKAQTPEIVDLWVQPAARGRRWGRLLLQGAVQEARQRGAGSIGLGVGLTQDYGAAHRLYAQEGFLPDGTGLWVRGRQARTGETITADHTAMLMWVKNL